VQLKAVLKVGCWMLCASYVFTLIYLAKRTQNYPNVTTTTLKHFLKSWSSGFLFSFAIPHLESPRSLLD
jgi:hypothetical protein